MEHIKSDRTDDTPGSDCNPDTRVVYIFGDSYPEFPGRFYKPILEWIEQLIQQDPPDLTARLHLPYFNTSSSKCIMDLLEMLEDYQEKGGNVKVVWEYDEGDEDAMEAGEELDDDIDIPFEFKEVKE